jgi:prevent-host-death family protein
LYDQGMDVAVSELRANLRAWVERAREGDEVVVTERGVPVARLVPIDAEGVLARLEADGLLTRPRTATRPVATGRRRARATGAVSELVVEHRR